MLIHKGASASWIVIKGRSLLGLGTEHSLCGFLDAPPHSPERAASYDLLEQQLRASCSGLGEQA